MTRAAGACVATAVKNINDARDKVIMTSNAVGLSVFFFPLVVSCMRSAVLKFHSALHNATTPKVIGSMKYGSLTDRSYKCKKCSSVKDMSMLDLFPKSVQPVIVLNMYEKETQSGICTAGSTIIFHVWQPYCLNNAFCLLYFSLAASIIILSAVNVAFSLGTGLLIPLAISFCRLICSACATDASLARKTGVVAWMIGLSSFCFRSPRL